MPGGEQPEPVVEPLGELPGRQRAHARGGQLQREGDAVQPRADLHHVGIGLAARAGAERGAGGEQLDGRLQVERRHGVHGLALDAQRLLAGGQHAQLRRGPQQPPGQLGDLLDDVLAVVQHEQRRPTGERGGQAVLERAGRVVAQPEHGGDRLGDLDSSTSSGPGSRPSSPASRLRRSW